MPMNTKMREELRDSFLKLIDSRSGLAPVAHITSQLGALAKKIEEEDTDPIIKIIAVDISNDLLCAWQQVEVSERRLRYLLRG